ncbi:MAG: hypothetical protein ACKPKO_53830, partial [Candidatus Fonsibacter sp.]
MGSMKRWRADGNVHKDNFRETQAGAMVCVPAWSNGMLPAWPAQGRGLKSRRGPGKFIFVVFVFFLGGAFL